MYDGEQYTKIGVPFDTTRFSDEERGMPNQTIKTFEKNNKNYCIFLLFEYTICNRVARSRFGIGDQAETCAQLFLLGRDLMDFIFKKIRNGHYLANYLVDNAFLSW